MNTEKLLLSGTQSYITLNRTDAFGVNEGEVYVFMAEWDENEKKPGRRIRVCEVKKGTAFPALFYRDEEEKTWCFVIVAKTEQAELVVMPRSATYALKRNMVRRIDAPNYEYESFENSLIELYKKTEFQEKLKIGKKEQDEAKEDEDIFRVASYAVSGYGTETMPKSGEPLYDALSFLCSKAKIPLPEWTEIKDRFGKEVTAPLLAEAVQLICRRIRLDKNWYHNDCGLLLAMLEDDLVALAPDRLNGYTLYNTETGKKEKLTQDTAKKIHPHAYVVSRTLPQRKLNKKDIISFVLKSINCFDVIRVVLLGLLTILAGVLIPMLNQKIYDDYIPMGDFDMVRMMCLVAGTFMLGNLTFTLGKKLSEYRLSVRAGYDMQSAVYHRVFELPERFFRKYESADLAQRLISFGGLTSQMVGQSITTVFSVVMTLVYVIQMFVYSSRLAVFGIFMILVYCIIVYVIMSRTLRYDAQIAEVDGNARGKLYQYIDGIEKIRMANASSSAILRYTKESAEKQKATIKRNRISAAGDVFMEASGTIFSMVLYFLIVRNMLSGEQTIQMGSFIAFNTAFGSFSGSVTELIKAYLAYRSAKPLFERIKPILEEEPETVPTKNGKPKTIAGELSGRIDLDHVVFSYGKDENKVLKGISLSIQPGEYVALVGTSGCGKSTLMKLLLGFESPDSGCIRYDEQDLETLDKRSVRRQIGTVLQNGKLIAGSIYENISITAESPTMDEVKQAVRAAGLEQDIEDMPMGLETLLNETNSGISGGQSQRILIARALCGRPAILLFDEATSALDNITQDIVCKSLDELDITRIVIAHRLSTIQKCDRILVMDQGRIVQDGSYKQLMQDRSGVFYKLASRQLADEKNEGM